MGKGWWFSRFHGLSRYFSPSGNVSPMTIQAKIAECYTVLEAGVGGGTGAPSKLGAS